MSRFRFHTVEGYFLQDDPETDPGTFDFAAVNFGLKNRSYPADTHDDHASSKLQWERFESEIRRLNTESEPSVVYKLLYIGRHGQGVHNVAEGYYGTVEWDRHWSKLDGNGTTTWSDAHLTEKSADQAQSVNAFWRRQISDQHIPMPQKYYSSPFHRCLATANVTFSGLDFPEDCPFVPVIKELLRETIGEHTCDRRSNETYIHQQFPKYEFEAGFAEDDPLWKPDVRENDAETDKRMKKLLDDIFNSDQSTFISLTSHSGAIASILRVVGHRKFKLLTGSAISVLVRAEST